MVRGSFEVKQLWVPHLVLCSALSLQNENSSSHPNLLLIVQALLGDKSSEKLPSGSFLFRLSFIGEQSALVAWRPKQLCLEGSGGYFSKHVQRS